MYMNRTFFYGRPKAFVRLECSFILDLLLVRMENSTDFWIGSL